MEICTEDKMLCFMVWEVSWLKGWLKLQYLMWQSRESGFPHRSMWLITAAGRGSYTILLLDICIFGKCSFVRNSLKSATKKKEKKKRKNISCYSSTCRAGRCFSLTPVWVYLELINRWHKGHKTYMCLDHEVFCSHRDRKRKTLNR